MNFNPFRSIGIILLMTMGIVLSFYGFLPSSITPTIPSVRGAPPNNPAVLGVFSETTHSNAVLSGGSGTTFTLDVNVTDAGPIKGFDIVLNFTGTALHFLNSAYKGTTCSTCLLATVSTTLFANYTATCKLGGPPCTQTNNVNYYRLSVADSDQNNPFVSGTGILFRVSFTVQANSQFSNIKFNPISILTNPGSVPFNQIDGYFDNRATVANWPISESPTTVTIVRPISQFATQTGTTSVTLGTFTGSPGVITFKALSMPTNTGQGFVASTCSATCTSTLTITVHGGAKGAPGTSPSGTYFIPIIGNSTGNGMRSTWLKLIIQAPAAPVFTFTTSAPTTFNQQAGNYTLIPLSVALTSGSNDSIALGTNCFPQLGGGTCIIKPAAGSFPLSAVLNVSTVANYVGLPLPHTFKFNATAVTQGTYSEIVISKNITISLTLRRDHDTAALTSAPSRSFGYNLISLSLANQLKVNVTVANYGTVSETFNVNATAKTVLRSNPNLRWVDTAGTGVYVSGETVILDNDGNGIYGVGKLDTGIAFVDSGTANGHWDCTTIVTNTCTAGEPVIYDSDGNSVYNVGKFHNDTLIFGTAPANNTSVLNDFKMSFVDTNNDAVWETGETIFYNSITANGVYDSGELLITGSAPSAEPVLVGSTPTLGTVLSINNLSFVDSNYNNIMSNADVIAYDTNGDGIYETSEPIARGVAPSGGILVGTAVTVTLAAGAVQTAHNATQISWDPGSLPRGVYQITGFTVPVTGEFNFVNNAVQTPAGYTQKLKGDVNGDCKVDIVDLATVGSTFGKTLGGAGYNANADLDNSKVIDIVDLVLVAGNFGQSCPS